MGFKYHKQINKTFNYQNDKEKQINRMREGEKRRNYSFNNTKSRLKSSSGNEKNQFFNKR
jgi:hypothetical protein